MLPTGDLTLQITGERGRCEAPRVVVIGEVLWDMFPGFVSLGGAPLNFAAHAARLGLQPVLVSALGEDDLGRKAAGEIANLGLDLRMIRRSSKWGTGTASVSVDRAGQPAFTILRPAAYDDICLSPADLSALGGLKPTWVYYGTLFPSTREGKSTLMHVLNAIPKATRFYDVNLRPGCDSMETVSELLSLADVVKLNESESNRVRRLLGVPEDMEAFCRAACARFGWRAVCVSLGERGCALFDGTEFVRASGENVHVIDTVGAGDAFAAAIVHGLSSRWPASQIAQFANRVGALVASRAGAIPQWNIAEALTASL